MIHWIVVRFKTCISGVISSLSEQERQWKDSNDYLKFEISELRQQLQDFKTHVFNEIKRCQQPASFAEEASFKGRKPSDITGSICWCESKREAWKLARVYESWRDLKRGGGS